MADYNLIHIHANHTCTWMRLSAEGKIIEQRELLPLSELASFAPLANLMVLVPGQQIVITTVKLPKMSRAEMLQAIPYALEDKLVSSIEQLFFAIGDKENHGETIVAVVEREKLAAWLKELHAMNLRPGVLLPDYLAVPWQKNTWTVVTRNDMAMARLHKQAGFSTDQQSLLFFLKNYLRTRESKTPLSINFIGDTTLPLEELTQDNVEIKQQPYQLETAYDFKELINQPAFNLLQGKFRGKRKATKERNYWRWAIALLVTLIIVFFGGKIAELIYLKTYSSRLDKRIFSAYQRAFPQAKPTDNIKLQMQAPLQQLRQAARSNSFLRLTATAGAALNQDPSLQLQNLVLQNNALELTLRAFKLEDLENLAKTLINKGLQVNQSDLTVARPFVTAKLTVKE